MHSESNKLQQNIESEFKVLTSSPKKSTLVYRVRKEEYFFFRVLCVVVVVLVMRAVDRQKPYQFHWHFPHIFTSFACIISSFLSCAVLKYVCFSCMSCATISADSAFKALFNAMPYHITNIWEPFKFVLNVCFLCVRLDVWCVW